MSINKKSLIKAISLVTITAVIIAALLGLGLLFSIVSYADWIENLLLTCLTLVVAGILGFNSVNAITSGNKVGLAAGIMLVISVVLYLILIWAASFISGIATVYNYAVVIVSSLSILLNVIISNYVALGKSLIFVQVVYYILLAYIITTIAFVILGSGALIQYWQVFVAAIIISIVFFVILVVKGKTLSQKDTEIKVKEGYVTIPKSEYEELKAEIERLKAIVDNKGE